MGNHDYGFFKAGADYIRSKTDFQPEIGIILGSSLGPFAETVEQAAVFDYGEIPNFLTATVASHAGKLILGTVAGRRVACLSGRFHSYEGYDFEQLTAPIRLLCLLGVKSVILTNAAGAVNTDYHVGDVMVIVDHIKLNGASPLRGTNIPEFGPRFFDTQKMYTPRLRALAKRCGESSPLTLREGVYFFMPGPQFETPAEIRAIRVLGGDAVGMSTVTEAITAAHCGMEVLGLSVMTNMAAGVLDQPVTDEEVVEAGRRIARDFGALVTDIMKEM